MDKSNSSDMKSFSADNDDSISVVVKDLSVIYNVASTDRDAYDSASSWEKAQAKILGKNPEIQVQALKNINLVTHTGESVGILGRNGSGKSTLLRILGGLETPLRGTIYARSQPVLLGIAAALVPSMTGEYNALLGCLAMGMTLEEAHEAIPGIIELAGLEKAIYLPMETYSSGMGARLRFAIATAARPEILMIDEALNAGDSAFRQRSKKAMDKLRKSAGTVFLVSHSIDTVESMCSRVLWIDYGEIIMDGPTKEVTKVYRDWVHHLAHNRPHRADQILARTKKEYMAQNIVIK